MLLHVNSLNFQEGRLGGRNFPKGKLKAVLLLAAGLAIVAGIGTTLASNISLNSGTPVEFGQGVAQATSCDHSILVTPTSNFDNSLDLFTVSNITLSDIAATCMGKNFVIKLYGDSSRTALNASPLIVNLSGAPTDGNIFDGSSFLNDATVDVVVNNATLTRATINLRDLGSDSTAGMSSLSIAGITSDGVNPIPAQNVTRITIESHSSGYFQPIYGGNGGNPFNHSCPNGNIVKSIILEAQPSAGDGFYDYFALVCAPKTDIDNPGAPDEFVDWRNWYGYYGEVSSTCPTGELAVGLNVGPGGYVSGMGIRCAPYPAGSPAENQNIISEGQSTLPSYCPAGSWMTGVYGRRGAGVDSIGALCTVSSLI
jgi:hypothetical protein